MERLFKKHVVKILIREPIEMSELLIVERHTSIVWSALSSQFTWKQMCVFFVPVGTLLNG